MKKTETLIIDIEKETFDRLKEITKANDIDKGIFVNEAILNAIQSFLSERLDKILGEPTKPTENDEMTPSEYIIKMRNL